jgi:hypothetical protein
VGQITAAKEFEAAGIERKEKTERRDTRQGNEVIAPEMKLERKENTTSRILHVGLVEIRSASRGSSRLHLHPPVLLISLAAIAQSSYARHAEI